jgi:DNA-binding NarL/FixJ family response regulator
MSNCSPIRVLSVDDHPLIHDGIAFALQTQRDMTLIAEASNGREAVESFRLHRPQVTLMDLQMPVMSGIDAIIAIRQVCPTAKIIALTTYSGDVQAIRALKAGAAGYLLKSMLGEELIDTIRCVYSGGGGYRPKSPLRSRNIWQMRALPTARSKSCARFPEDVPTRLWPRSSVSRRIR